MELPFDNPSAGIKTAAFIPENYQNTHRQLPKENDEDAPF